MRVVFSVLSLLVVVFVVMKLAATQLGAALPAAATGADSATPADGTAPARPSAQAVAGQMQQALAQGAAARASAALADE